MAYFTYRTVKMPDHKWIECLRFVEPVSTASARYTEVHFTEPKKALVNVMARPHVTFCRAGNSTHWYLAPKGDSWGVELGGKNTDMTLDCEGDIAQKVVDDAVALNYINAPVARKIVDDEGFETVESRKSAKKRVVTSFKKS